MNDSSAAGNYIYRVSDDVWIQLFGEYMTLEEVMFSVRCCCKLFNSLTLRKSYYQWVIEEIIEKLVGIIDRVNSPRMKMFCYDYQRCSNNDEKTKFKKNFYCECMFDYYFQNFNIDFIKNNCNAHEMCQIYYEMRSFIIKYKEDLYDAIKYGDDTADVPFEFHDFDKDKPFRTLKIEKKGKKIVWTNDIENILYCSLPLLLKICRYDLFYSFKTLLKQTYEGAKIKFENFNYGYNSGNTIEYFDGEYIYECVFFQMTPLHVALKCNAYRIVNYILSSYKFNSMCKDNDDSNDDDNSNNAYEHLNNSIIKAMINTKSLMFGEEYSTLQTLILNCGYEYDLNHENKACEKMLKIMSSEHLIVKREMTHALHLSIEKLSPIMLKMLINYGGDINSICKHRTLKFNVRMGTLMRLVKIADLCLRNVNTDKVSSNSISKILQMFDILLNGIDFENFPNNNHKYDIGILDHIISAASTSEKAIVLSDMFVKILNKITNIHGPVVAIEKYLLDHTLLISAAVLTRLENVLENIGKLVSQYKRIIVNNEIKRQKLYEFVNGIGASAGNRNSSPYLTYCEICCIYIGDNDKCMKKILDILLNDIGVDVTVTRDPKHLIYGSMYIEQSPKFKKLKSMLEWLEQQATQPDQ